MKKVLNSSFGIILLIFFFNGFGTPFGIEFSMLLVPFFLYYLVQTKTIIHLFIPVYFLSVFSIIHLFIGVVFKDFLLSSLVLVSILLLLASFYDFYKKSGQVETVILRLTQLNFAFTLIAIISLIFNFGVSVFWYLEPFTAGYRTLPRLKLFELEASHYSFLLLPLFYYHFWKLLKHWELKTFLLFVSICVSLILSFSLGILAVIAISLVIVIFSNSLSLIKFKPTRFKLLGGLVFSLIILLTLSVFFPENPLFFRINNLFLGEDTSGRGRTYEAMEIGWKVLNQHNSMFGIGLGQFKIIGRESLIYYYKFANMPDVARLPNAMAETLVVYGVVGFSLKILIQIGLFIRLTVYQNLFQFSLFISLFIYQFTGSYLFNEMEYIFWIMVFLPKLREFHNFNYFLK
jgi:hypothetical protein